MAGSLRLDTGELRERANSLGLLASEFLVADDFADNLEEAVGVHSDTQELRHQISSFASSWRIRREKMQTGLSELHEYVNNVATTFDDTDAQLAAGISGTQEAADFSQPTTSGGPNVV